MIKKYIKSEFLLLFLLFSAQTAYTIEQEIVYKDETSIVSTDELRFNATQQEAYDEVKQGTHQILTCLQQLEQVLVTDKVKFDTTKGLKKEILENVGAVKATLESLFTIYTTQEAFPDNFISGVAINKSCMDYLLPCLYNDISSISLDTFNSYINEQYMINKEQMSENGKLIGQYNKANRLKIQELRVATDNVGLTSFNKAFRYFQDVPMSLTGVPLMTTAQNTAFGLSLATLAYMIATYAAPRDGKFNFPTINVAALQDKKLDFNYVECEFAKLPFKDLIGSQELTTQEVIHTTKFTTEEVQKAMGLLTKPEDISKALTNAMNNQKANTSVLPEGFGIGNYIERIIKQSKANPITIGGLAYIGANTESIYKSATKYTQETYESMINYMRGETSQGGKGFNRQQNDVYFKDMINAEQLEAFALELADYMKHPARYENSGTAPSTGILLTGPSQTGKSFYAQAIKTLINEELKKDGKYGMQFWNISKEDVQECGIPFIFYLARKNSPCILFFDEIDMMGVHRDTDKKISSEFLTNMSGLLNDKNKQVIVIAATNVPDQLDQALLQNGRLGKQFQFELPSFQHRTEYLQQSLLKKNIKTLSDDDIAMIAHETEGETYNTLNTIIATALRLAIFKSRLVTKQDFEDALDIDLRHIRKNTSLTDDEKKIIAIYQSGQAAARHILSTPQQVIKITIDSIEKQAKGSFSLQKPAPQEQTLNQSYTQYEQPKPIKNGHVFTLDLHNNSDFLHDQDQEHELLAILAGQAALELITGKMYSNFCKEDRAIILHTLEVKISQGGNITDDIRKEAIALKDALYIKAKAILQPHVEFVQNIMNHLMKHRNVNKSQWAQLTSNYKI